MINKHTKSNKNPNNLNNYFLYKIFKLTSFLTLSLQGIITVLIYIIDRPYSAKFKYVLINVLQACTKK